jgi:hypothetical protein
MRDDKKESREPDITDLVLSSDHEIEYVKNSQVWKDMIKILEDWNNGLRDDYDTADTMDQVRYTQGISMCIKYVKNLPDAMQTILKMEEKEDDNSTGR